MPIRFDQFNDSNIKSGAGIGILDHEIVELAAAFRRFGFWRIDLDTALFYGSADIFAIFDMEYRDGPINMLEFRDHLHPEDIPLLMESFERTSTLRHMHHTIYRVLAQGGEYKYVRTVGKYREKPDGSGEIIGITYEFFERLRTAAFCEDGQSTPAETGDGAGI